MAFLAKTHKAQCKHVQATLMKLHFSVWCSSYLIILTPHTFSVWGLRCACQRWCFVWRV